MHRFVAAIVAGWATATAAPATAQAEEKAAVVCESDASGRAMTCRDAWPGEDAAPFRRVAPGAPSRTGAAPTPAQPVLATPSPRAPQATPAPEYLRSERQVAAQSADVAPAADTTPESAKVSNPTATSVAGSAPVLSTMPRTTTPETVSAPAQRAIPVAATKAVVAVAERELPAPSKPIMEPVTAPRAEPVVTAAPENPINAAPISVAQSAAASEPKPRAEPVSAASSAPELAKGAGTADTAPTVAVEPIAQPDPVAASPAAELFGSREFAALEGSRYTLELANATSAAPLRALAARLRLGGAIYLIHLRNPDADRWLLTWSDHATQAEARAARLLVPADADINSAWPRRLAPLQRELVSP